MIEVIKLSDLELFKKYYYVDRYWPKAVKLVYIEDDDPDYGVLQMAGKTYVRVHVDELKGKLFDGVTEEFDACMRAKTNIDVIHRILKDRMLKLTNGDGK